ncbi:MAG: hypothetical protein ACKVVT_09010 [Dehalococcoidia bacterium]
MPPSITRALMILPALAAIALAACGGGDSGTSSPTAAATTTTATPTTTTPASTTVTTTATRTAATASATAATSSPTAAAATATRTPTPAAQATATPAAATPTPGATQPPPTPTRAPASPTPIPATPTASGEGPRNVTVTVNDNFFSPSQLSLPRGSTVTWTWAGEAIHDVTGPFGRSELQKSGSFTLTFSQAGTFQYVCSVHNAPPATFMRGTIVIQ